MDYFNCLIFLIILKCSSTAKIPIAGFFHTGDAEQELVFKLAVENVNHIIQDNNYGEEKVFLEERIEHVSSFDSYNISRRVCDLTNEGIGGIFGPQSLEAVGITESLCDSMEIPMIKTFWDISSMPSRSAINLYPDPDLLAKALVAVVNDMDWNKYTIIYENNDGLIRLQELLKSHKRSFTSEGHVPFTVWQLDPNTRDLRPILKEIQRTSESHIVLDCSTERIIDILKQAKEVKMLGDYHSYVLTSLDAHTLDYSDLQLETTNITTLRLINPQSHYVQSTVQDWVFFHKTLLKDNLQLTADTLKTEAALTYDAIKVYSEALQRVQKELPEEMEVMPLQCSNSEKWYHGSIINNEMKKIIVEGMTGTIKFDEEGRRSFFTLDITELTKNGFRKIGQWDPEKGISYTRTESQMKQEMYKSISNKTFMVVSRLGRPYLSEVDPSLEGNARYEGYSMDLIDEIAKDLNFKYKFYLAPDGAYGSFNKDTKQWNGLIKELRERKADLAICDLTITYERRSAVDFTMPFMNLGISILYSKPTKQPPDLFSFLSPFSIDVWTYMATAYLGVSLLLYFLARCTPDEWDNPHPCDPDPTELECIFSLHNCLWFSIGSLMAQGCDLLPKISPMEWKNPHPCKPDPDELENALPIYNAIWHNIGSLMQQGSDIAPQALSTRVVAGMWWFFVLIMISSYTANLAAFLTMDRMEATIESVEDLANQNKIKYGVMTGGSSANFFRDSNTSLYQKIWSQMDSARPSVFTKNNDEGVDRVLRGKRGYAFFMESTTIEYQKEKHCNKLMQVGGLLDSKGYGIAMPFHSPYRIAISGSVLKMQESGKLLALKDKWWKGESKCIVEDKEEADSSELGIENVGGVFLVLAVGCVVGFFVSILEFLWNVRKVAVEEKISPGEAFLLELKFAIQCYGTTKPVRKPREGSVVEEDFAECVEEHVEEEEEDRGFFGDENMEEEYIRLNGFSNNIRAKSTQSYS